MAVKDCIDKVNKAMGSGRLSKAQIAQILEEIEEEALKLDNLDYREAIREVGERFNKYLSHQAKEEKRRALLQLKAKQQTISKIENLMEQGLTMREAFIASIVGLRRDGVFGAMESTAGKQTARSSKNMSEFIKHLEAENVLSFFRDKDEAIQLQVLEAIEALNTPGADKPTGQIGKVAEIYHAHITRVREALRVAGVDTRELDGFAMSHSHDPSLIKIAGRDEWIANTHDKLNYQKIFGTENYSQEDVTQFLNSTYAALSSGVRISPGPSLDDAIAQTLKPRNMAERLGQSRVIHFKSTKDAFEYNKMFGRQTMQESLMFSLRSAGFYSALMDDWGPNPTANFDNIKKKLKQKYRDDIETIEDLEKGGFLQKVAGSDINALFANIDGTAFIAENPKSARFHANLRGWLAMSKLGQATISAISDTPIMANTLAQNGMAHADGYVRSFASAVGRLPKSERKHFASMVDTYQEVMVGSMANRLGLFDEQPGKMQEMLRLFYKANALEWWTNAHKEGMASALAENLANHRHLSYDQLGNRLGNQLSQFGIDEADWDAFRATEPQTVNGKVFMTSENAEAAGIDVDKWDTYFIETVNTGVLTPGARERAAQNWGFKPGSAIGELVRTAMLFKSFPITFNIKVLGPAIKQAKNGDVMYMLSTIIGMSAFGAVALSAKDVLKGRDPVAKFNNAKTSPELAFKYWTAIALQGGGLGIYGDFMFGQYNRFGGSLPQTLAGPVYGGMLSDIGRVYSDVWLTGTGGKELDKLGASVLGAAKNYIPGGNLPYIAPALNYLMIYQLQEALNPGYLKRMESRMQREQGVQFIKEPIDLRPSSVVD